MFEKHLQKTIEREEKRDQEWFNRHKRTKVKTFFYEPRAMLNPLENKIAGLQEELQFLLNTNNDSPLSRIKKVRKKLNNLKLEHPEVFLTL